MADGEAPRNRRERRAAAKESGKPMAASISIPKMKLAQPDRSKPKGKTLMDLYEEKRSLLEHGQPFDKTTNPMSLDSSGNILEAGLGSDDPIGPIGNAVFWAMLLGMVHFTFDVLVYNQYRQEMEWMPVIKRTFTILPVLFALTAMMGTEITKRYVTVRQVFFFAVAVAAGCYTIHVGNRYGYYFVMKQTPPLVTLWIWSVIEMKLTYALVSIAANLGFWWYKGYEVF